MGPPYLCLTCNQWQTDEPPWAQIRESKTGKLYVWKCPTCRALPLRRAAGAPREEEATMAMSKKHYEQIADAVAETVLDPYERVALTARLNAIFAADNPLFNREIFARRADAVRIEEVPR